MADELEMTYLQRSRIRVEALVPFIRALENELGVERAHELTREVFAESARAADAKRTGNRPRNPPDRMPITQEGLDATFAADGALVYEILRENAEVFEMNVTGCRYKALMEEFEAVDLGALFFCDNDFRSARTLGVELTRSQTCMEGASHCDFRYKLRKS